MKHEVRDIISDYLGVQPVLINSSLVSAQHRERNYWTNIPINGLPDDKGIIISDILENGDIPKKYFLSEKALAKMNKYIGNYVVCGKAPTLTTELAHSTGRTTSPKLVSEIGQKRRATPIECERLQTLPDDYTKGVCDTERYKMLGNGWTVDIIAWIFSFIKNT